MNKIDQLIAENIMKWTQDHSATPSETIAYKDESGNTYRYFRPSTNIVDAWAVLDKVCQERNWRAVIDRNQTETLVEFKTQMGAHMQLLGHQSTPPLAICDAVLQTVHIELNDIINEQNVLDNYPDSTPTIT